MSNTYQKKEPDKREQNPIWRGIGCIMIVVVPLISYLAADIVIDQIRNNAALESIRTSDFMRTYFRALDDSVKVDLLVAEISLNLEVIVVAVVIALLAFALLSIVYGLATAEAKKDPIEEEAKAIEREERKLKAAKRKRRGR